MGRNINVAQFELEYDCIVETRKILDSTILQIPDYEMLHNEGRKKMR